VLAAAAGCGAKARGMERRWAVLDARGVSGIWSGGTGVGRWMCSGVVDKSVGWGWVREPSGDGI